MANAKKSRNRYSALIERIFFRHWKEGITHFEFEREEIEHFAKELKMVTPKNLGDIIYSFRFRVPLPEKILKTQPFEREWTIHGAGKSRYRFRLSKITRITPNANLITIPIPDATPELIKLYKLGDEQALLAVIRYNRLIDTFLGLTTYSLQNHLRTTVKDVGQIEIDELYLGIDKHGSHFVIPVQAKSGKDQIGTVQIDQDYAFVKEKFPNTRCIPIAAQFMSDGVAALFKLTLHDDEVKVEEEKHYKLVPASSFDHMMLP